MNRISHLAVVASVMAHMAFGFLWYAVLFHAPWMNGLGPTAADLDQTNPLPFAIDAVGWLLLSYVLAAVLNRLDVASVGKGTQVGAMLGAALALPVLLAHYAFIGVSPVVMLIDGSNAVLCFAISGAILGGWPRRASAS